MAEEQTICDRADIALNFWNEVVTKASWFDAEKECVVILLLNRKNRIVNWNMISVGSATGALCAPREVLRSALIGGGTAFLMMHNHPSGDPSPSSADLGITRIIREGAKAIGMTFQDHIIAGTPKFDPRSKGYYSFREAGII